jgi:hypothetical protein
VALTTEKAARMKGAHTMNKESLIAAGFTEEQAAKIMEMHKKAIDGNYVPKATFEAEREKCKNLTAQIAERDKQIAELGTFKGTAEQLKMKVAELEKQNKEAREKFEADLLQVQKEAAIRLEIASSVIDPDDVIPKLDQSKIVFKDGKIVSGLTEQLEELKKTKPHYFKTEKKDPEGIPPGWLFGKTPPESSDDMSGDEKSEAELFGEMLASFKLSSNTAAKKVAETYFK